MILEIFAISFILGLFIDVAWWNVNYKKYEKGLEAHEHYHIGLEIGILGVILSVFIPIFSSIAMGLMVAFFLAEWSQDHKFALKSGHFKESSIIGIILFIAFIALVIIL